MFNFFKYRFYFLDSSVTIKEFSRKAFYDILQAFKGNNFDEINGRIYNSLLYFYSYLTTTCYLSLALNTAIQRCLSIFFTILFIDLSSPINTFVYVVDQGIKKNLISWCIRRRPRRFSAILRNNVPNIRHSKVQMTWIT